LLSFRHIIGTGGGDGWSRGVHSRRQSSFSVDGLLLERLLFFIGGTEDDDVVVTGWSKKPMVEVIEESPGELLIS
jgi:hypothetical protein